LQSAASWGEPLLEHLCRYVLRPPVAQGALELTPDGTVLLRLRRPWRDGTRAIRFEPSELLEKLAAMVPKPRINLLVYHGVFAPNARGRRDAVRRARESAPPGTATAAATGVEAGDTAAAAATGTAGRTALNGAARETGAHPVGDLSPSDTAPAPTTTPPPPPSGGYTRPQYYPWADLLRRTFAIDVLACPGCGGRLRLLATIADPAVIAQILRHLGLPVAVPVPAPARQAAWWPGTDTSAGPAAGWPA
jgi:hypothetical protein